MEDKKRRSLFERIFRRPPEIDFSKAQLNKEAEASINAIKTSSIKLSESVDKFSSSEKQIMALYDEMDQDAVISAALDLFADNATIIDKKTGHVASVSSGNREFQEEINDFLWNIFKVDSESWHIIRDIAKYGKVLLDTNASVDGSAWTFSQVDDPYNVHALVDNTNKLRYFAVSPEKDQDDTKSSSIFAYASIKNNTEYKLEPKSKYILGLNSRETIGKMKVATTSTLTGQTVEEELKIRTGRSILAPVLSTWQTLNTMEQALVTNRLTKATQFKIVQVDIADSTNKEATQIQEALRTAFKTSEVLDTTQNKFRNRLAPPTVDDIVIITKRGEKGAIDVTPIGGEMSEAPMKDIDYMRNKLFAGLGVLKAYLGFEETTPGGLGDSTLTKLDERIGRRVQRLQAILADVYKDAIEYYWTHSRDNRTFHNIPDYTILMGKVSTKEEEEERNILDESFRLADSLIALATNELFVDKVDPDKLFQYVFEDMLNIDTQKIDKMPSEDEIEVEINKLMRVEEQSKFAITNKYTKEAEKSPILEGTHKQLLSLEDFSHFIEDTEIILEDENYNRYTLEHALRLKRFKDVLSEDTYKDLRATSKLKDPQRLAKSKKSIIRYTGLDRDNFITFSVTAEDPAKNRAEGKPTSYVTKIKLKDIEKVFKEREEDEEDRTLVRKAIHGNIAVSCNCPAAKYWGQQYLGTQKDYSIDLNDIAPTRNIPTQPLCKHTLATLNLFSFWWQVILKDLEKKKVIRRVKRKVKKDAKKDARQAKKDARQANKDASNKGESENEN